jgi:C-terminal processing protease CtpA/Prc
MKKVLLIVALILPALIFAKEDVVGYLGVVTKSLDEAMKTALNLDHGVLVDKVMEDSPAHEADIKIGDIIFKIDKEEIDDHEALRKVVQKKPNKTVSVVLYRKGKELKKSIKLSAREKAKFSFQMEFPNLGELKELMNKGTDEMKKELERLKGEIEQLKKEIEEIKTKIK